MLEKRYKNIVYFIGFTIALTIAFQVYWNVKIYDVNKQQLNNQIHVSFDKTIEDYYNNLAKSNVLTLVNNDKRLVLKNKAINDNLWVKTITDSIAVKNFKENSFSHSKNDNINIQQFEINDFDHISIFKGETDSLKFQDLTTKILISFREQAIDLKKIDSLLNIDLLKKGIDIPYRFVFTYKNILNDSINVLKHKTEQLSKEYITIDSNSSFLPNNSKLQLRYTNSTTSIFKRMLGSVFLSLLLSIIIIGSLIFLLKTIFNQKQLSDVKNDLISNITHEFKTPISTISLALEGLENSNIIKNETKRKQYLTMSAEQLNKLNQMVEKLLETATLKTNQFKLDKEQVNLSELIKNSVKKYQFSNPEKSISLTIGANLNFLADAFHFENALNNIIDNAIKYGGNLLKIKGLSTKNNIEISIEDNGIGFENQYKQKIFDQFYRIPTGNIHNVKGFGIGLYYTKNIIEKHGGKIIVSENKKGKVVFKIALPNGN